jgi:high-affinity K+ transport system ATPase subunit B
VLLVLHLHAHRARRRPEARAEFVPFTAQTQVSGVDLAGPEGIRRIREGAAQTLLAASTAPTTEPGLDGCTRTGDVGRGGEGDGGELGALRTAGGAQDGAQSDGDRRSRQA